MSKESLILKQGDTIEWNFNNPKYKNTPSFYRKTFRAKIACVFESKREYGVYADYGQDFIPFDECVKIEL